MLDRILVAVDGSDHASRALKLAADLQQKLGSELFVLCVYRHHSLLESSMSMVRSEEPEILDDSMREHASSIVESAKQLAAERGAENVRGFVKGGPPARTIVGFAKDKEASLIVLGSRGIGDAEGFLLGSVSHKVSSLADTPVLLV